MMETMHCQSKTRFVGVLMLTFALLAGHQQASQADTKATFTAEQQKALTALQDFVGILMAFDEQRSDQPLVLVDFNNHPEFQDDWLKHLLPFPELTTVRVAGTALTDAGVAHLAKLPKLSNLDLSSTSITDAGLSQLHSCTQLRKLDIQKTRTTEAGVAQLHKAVPQLEITTDSKESSATSDTKRTSSNDKSVVTFSANDIRQWRENLNKLSMLPGTTPNGWSKSPIEPAKLLTVFPKLRLRKGFVLRAYVFKEDGNSNGFVWALPINAAFPTPDECPRLESHFLNPPKPFDALDDSMEAIEGDDSLESYFQASILRRELKEFGGGWHGIQWGMHTVLDDDPWKNPAKSDDGPSLDRPDSKASEWKWFASKPTNWSPEVRPEGDRVIVTFYTYTALAADAGDGKTEKERIIQHKETYRRGKYRPLIVEKKIAEGPKALLH